MSALDCCSGTDAECGSRVAIGIEASAEVRGGVGAGAEIGVEVRSAVDVSAGSRGVASTEASVEVRSVVGAGTDAESCVEVQNAVGAECGNRVVTGTDADVEMQNFSRRSDRVGRYLTGYLDGFEFLFLTEEYVEKQGKDIGFISNVPIPFRVKRSDALENPAGQMPVNDGLRRTDTRENYAGQMLVNERTRRSDTRENPADQKSAIDGGQYFNARKNEIRPSGGSKTLLGEGVSPYILAENMAWIMGISPNFPHAKAYEAFLNTLLPGKAAEAISAIAAYAADNDKDLYKACVFFRAALCMDPRYLTAMYGYARVCKDLYSQGEDNEFIGNFKAESMEYFELTTLAHPEFPDSFYYLGYAYLNMGLYQKAFLAWKRYLELSTDEERQEELRSRLQQITVPMEIERGCNAVLAGRYGEGISILEPHTKSKYKDWWPLYYYLGDAYKKTQCHEKAIDMYKKVLSLKPSHVASMDELVSIYEFLGDDELVLKYRNKSELIKNGGFKAD